ncbi:MAG: hypothetical protein ACTSWY_13640 [Promethearchaeota archaeon]
MGDISRKFIPLNGDQTGELGLSKELIDDLLKEKELVVKRLKNHQI